MNVPKTKFRSILSPAKPDTPIPPEPSHAEIVAAVDTVADAHDVGTLVRPSDRTVAPRDSLVATNSKVTALTPRRERKVNPAPSARWTIEAPEYLLKQIKERMIKEGGTQRYLTLKAFKADGYTIHDIDLYKDGRREK